MNKPIVLLQNAWSPLYAGGIWPRESWLLALHRSRSGQRLRLAFPDPDAVHYDNTTPWVGGTSESVLPPDLEHVGTLLALEPPYVIACGAQATRVVARLWGGRLLAIPHPAYRVVTNQLFLDLRDLITKDDFLRSSLTQQRGHVSLQPLA